MQGCSPSVLPVISELVIIILLMLTAIVLEFISAARGQQARQTTEVVNMLGQILCR
jgi:uncharacterized membrane protein